MGGVLPPQYGGYCTAVFTVYAIVAQPRSEFSPFALNKPPHLIATASSSTPPHVYTKPCVSSFL